MLLKIFHYFFPTMASLLPEVFGALVYVCHAGNHQWEPFDSLASVAQSAFAAYPPLPDQPLRLLVSENVLLCNIETNERYRLAHKVGLPSLSPLVVYSVCLERISEPFCNATHRLVGDRQLMPLMLWGNEPADFQIRRRHLDKLYDLMILKRTGIERIRQSVDTILNSQHMDLPEERQEALVNLTLLRRSVMDQLGSLDLFDHLCDPTFQTVYFNLCRFMMAPLAHVVCESGKGVPVLQWIINNPLKALFCGLIMDTRAYSYVASTEETPGDRSFASDLPLLGSALSMYHDMFAYARMHGNNQIKTEHADSDVMRLLQMANLLHGVGNNSTFSLQGVLKCEQQLTDIVKRFAIVNSKRPLEAIADLSRDVSTHTFLLADVRGNIGLQRRSCSPALMQLRQHSLLTVAPENCQNLSTLSSLFHSNLTTLLEEGTRNSRFVPVLIICDVHLMTPIIVRDLLVCLEATAVRVPSLIRDASTELYTCTTKAKVPFRIVMTFDSMQPTRSGSRRAAQVVLAAVDPYRTSCVRIGLRDAVTTDDAFASEFRTHGCLATKDIQLEQMQDRLHWRKLSINGQNTRVYIVNQPLVDSSVNPHDFIGRTLHDDDNLGSQYSSVHLASLDANVAYSALCRSAGLVLLYNVNNLSDNQVLVKLRTVTI